ncbi:MAG TPA: c-type cytochrome, partial [Gemmatimonadales bacterium]|nr:c-type cytochrome [Gemmatimonadales bacterium]
ACGGGDKNAAADTTGMASTPPAAEPAPPAGATDTGSGMAPSADTGAKTADTATAKTQDSAKKTSAAKPAGKAAGGGGSAAQVAEGEKIFHGQEAGGTCTACHGQDAKGTAMAPNLTDSEWLNGDGSLTFIEHTVTTGVPKPKSHPAPMPPMGGASLSPDQIKAVAAYVYSLSHKS